jgi:phospholysine phosphohistidine inorganic pyrophosphate phosphatase
VAALRDSGAALRFVTNTTTRPRRAIVDRLHRLGFDPAPCELITPATLAVRHCVERGHTRVTLLMNDAVKEDFSELEETGEHAQAVIVGDLGDAFGYPVLKPRRPAADGRAELVALQKNRFWLTPDGLSLDVGAFAGARAAVPDGQCGMPLLCRRALDEIGDATWTELRSERDSDVSRHVPSE